MIPSDDLAANMVLVGMVLASALLAWSGPLFLTAFAAYVVYLLAAGAFDLGGCWTVHNFMLLTIGCLALPGACLMTSRWFYRSRRDASGVPSRHLGNILAPLFGLMVGFALMFAAQAAIDHHGTLVEECRSA